MDFKISKLHQADGEDERLVLLCTKDANIGDYLIMDATYNSKGVLSNILKHVFWFPKKEIKKDEWVVLYTKPGVSSITLTTHFFFIGSNENIWNDNIDSVTLIKIDSYDVKQFKDIHVKK